MAVPDHMVGEILDGELIVSPRPASRHANVTSGVGGSLWDPFHRPSGGGGGPGGWWILDEPELHLGGDALVPDMAGWRRDRLPVLPDTHAFELAPDWVCEVVSPSTGRVDRTRKMPSYAREKVAHLWLVDPIARTVEVYRLDGAHWTVVATHGGSEHARLEPFEAIAIDLDRWWMP